MTCKEFEKSIPAFIEGKLDYGSLKQFIGHMETCSDCREELEIQFLVTEGMQRLGAEGDVFDLQKELELRLEEAKSHMRFHSAFLYLAAGLETLAVVLIAVVVLWLVL